MQVLEWFSGLGGCTAALRPTDSVVQAIDQDEMAHRTYTQWWPHPCIRRNVAHMKPAAIPKADLWWMSPPCQPYSIRGRQQDLADRRSGAYLRLLELIDAHRPQHIALENVPWFEGSQGHERLATWLEANGYAVWSGCLSPGDLGIPMVRQRFFLVASQTHTPHAPAHQPLTKRLPAFLSVSPPDDTDIDPDVLTRFSDAFHTVDADDDDAIAACFTGAYARSPVYAGSYLRQNGKLRLFSPHEILALMGFPPQCRMPTDLPRRKAYKLVGNSVSVDCVRAVLAPLYDTT